jgi:hypothetical protein
MSPITHHGRARFRHGQTAVALAVSPDERHVASGGVDTIVRRWDVAALFASLTAPSKRPGRR